MDVDAMLDALSVPFPPHALKQREGAGGQQFTYVEAETVIRLLNAAVKVWDFRMTSHEWRPVIDYKDRNGNPKKAQTLVVFGEMTIPGLGTRSGTGVQVVDPEARSGEDLLKGALSDCLKNCAKHFNVGIDLYGPDLMAGEIPEAPKLPARGRTTSQNTIPDEDRYPSGVTKKQVGAIGAIAQSKGIPPDVVKQLHGKASATLLTSQEASALIKRLETEPNWNQPVEQAPMMPAGADRYTS